MSAEYIENDEKDTKQIVSANATFKQCQLFYIETFYQQLKKENSSFNAAGFSLSNEVSFW